LNVKIDDQGPIRRIPPTSPANVAYQVDEKVIVERGPQRVQTTPIEVVLEKGVQGTVKSLDGDTITIAWDAPVAPKVVPWAIQGGTIEVEMQVNDARRQAIRVFEDTGGKAVGIQVLDRREDMIPLRSLDEPTGANSIWADGWYDPIMALGSRISDVGWRDVCYGECKTSTPYGQCLQRDFETMEAGRKQWLYRFDWYPYVKWHHTVNGAGPCETGTVSPNEASCEEAAVYALKNGWMKVRNNRINRPRLATVDDASLPPECSIFGGDDGGTWNIIYNTNTNQEEGRRWDGRKTICSGVSPDRENGQIPL